MLVITIILLMLISYWTIEYIRHQRILQTIPVRIHVNGTRGKSSVVRLIAAGLRAGGKKTLAKVTGTLPRIIDENGLEILIPRPKMVNIIEQIDIVRFISNRKPDVMVIECMAVQPEYQWICEHKMVKSHIGVITNARMDHVREMGPSLENIARSLCNTIPYKGVAYTSSIRTFKVMQDVASKMKTQISRISSDTVTDEELKNFSFVEHPGNVSLALAVCEYLKIDRETALQGMYKTHPDAGAMKIFKVTSGNKTLFLINALAANDPESTLEIWRNLESLYSSRKRLIVLLNSRADRFDRSIQLLEMMKGQIAYDELVMIGQKVEQVILNAMRLKMQKSKITTLGSKKPEEVYHYLLDKAAEDGETIIFAIGNMGAGGLPVIKHFEKQSELQTESIQI